MAAFKNKRAVRSLRGELPVLVQSGAINAESARAIEKHYAQTEEESSNFGFIVLATIGAILIGAGIILLIAHNWDELSRLTRTVLALLPLVLAHALGLFVLLRRDESAPWRESVAVFNMAAVAATIALISQTYQILGSFSDFMRIWLLLCLPVVYLFRANIAAIVFMLGTTLFAWTSDNWLHPSSNAPSGLGLAGIDFTVSHLALSARRLERFRLGAVHFSGAGQRGHARAHLRTGTLQSRPR